MKNAFKHLIKETKEFIEASIFYIETNEDDLIKIEKKLNCIDIVSKGLNGKDRKIKEYIKKRSMALKEEKKRFQNNIRREKKSLDYYYEILRELEKKSKSFS